MRRRTDKAPARMRGLLAVGTVAAMVAAGPAAHAAKPPGGGGTGGATQATLSAPYGAVEQGYCGPAADRWTGRFLADPLAGPMSCLTGKVRESASYFGSNQPLGSVRTITATLRIDRAYVPVPRDPYLRAILAVSTGSPITSDSFNERFGWCGTAAFLTGSETQSLTPVTVTNREVTATCSLPSGWTVNSVWAGISLLHTNGADPVELDATLTSITVKS